MNSFNADQIVKYVKVITDNNKCVICDQLKGLRVRYPCGQSVCNNCILTAETCVFCLSPQDESKHVTDDQLSLRVEHASNLLKTFQELYNIDVYRRLRVSEQLKVEKQLFPECIQAPVKYSNSKRISNISNKENIKPTILPGENTSKPDIVKMENKINYVHQWLNKNDTILSEANYDLPRKPFTDINVNGQNVIRPKTTKNVTKKKKNLSLKKTRLKTYDPDVTDNLKSSTELKKNVKINKNNKKFGNCNKIKCDKNESGIVLDDETIFIDDFETVDKDKAALLAVLEAEKNNALNETIPTCNMSDREKVVNTNRIDKPTQYQKANRVQFYKKGSLFKDQCYESTNENSSKSNNVTITIETMNFVTTVKFSEEDKSTDATKFSIGVQTDTIDDCEKNSKMVELQLAKVDHNIYQNQHQITASEVGKNNKENLKDIAVTVNLNPTEPQQSDKKHKGLIIEESDSDSDIFPTENNILEVIAEVHRSETENNCNVLSQLQQDEYKHRKRHAVRGNTPTSTDSSDKENFDPNRAKRRKLDKKRNSKKY
ncbi:uncharacterized protein LOC112055095 [Bicyclus anynana]|uniref:Uncharacterized protein LOC112055095 n=1 Tax=Bicyclus anynana TaxID=110368 RepID=A0A6J1P107_BICAN|nr:uncharacterized protein LOC112055095 [Bicyclus anynana]